jgi:hypothetical protein
MIPIPTYKEPTDFDKTVRQPGSVFLGSKNVIRESDWKGKEYWQKSLPVLRNLSKKVCAYSATWIPHSTGSHSIDHFLCKNDHPQLAYEWSNFRYVSARFNSRKGRKVIVDPQNMQFNWFIIDFSTFFILPNTTLLDSKQLKLAEFTIDILKLNDDDELVEERIAYYSDFMSKKISFDYLQEHAPFIATEILRQKLSKK